MHTTDAPLVRLLCADVSQCQDRDHAALLITRLLLDERVTLRYFHGCARALRVLLAADEGSADALVSLAGAAIATSSTARWPAHPKLLHALAALERRPRKQSQVRFAEGAGLSRSYVSRRLLKETGWAAAEWCRAAALREAFRQLVRTPESVSVIAYAVGYEHVSQFDRDFLRIFGTQPGALRRRVARANQGLWREDTPH